MSTASRAHGDIASLSLDEALARLESRTSGLTAAEASVRLSRYGANAIGTRSVALSGIILRQVTGNALILILSAATLISYFLGQHVSSYYIFAMMFVSIALGVWNEYGAEKTVERLLSKISPTTTVLRGDDRQEIPVAKVTVGDVVVLSRGSIVPADLRLIETHHLQVNQSALTGESAPVLKSERSVAAATGEGIGALSDIAFTGTSVEAGWGKGVVFEVGTNTEFGKIARSTLFARPETGFEKGLSRFGKFLVEVIIVLTVIIFAVNALLGHPILDSLLFALAIAVGLTPELLPVIVTISLSHGAGILSKKNVVAKQLVAIENLGNMDVLCTDKTGTLTEGTIELVDYVNAAGAKDAAVLIAALEANDAIVHRHVIGNSIDAAVWRYALKNRIHPDAGMIKVVAEPLDFDRRAAFAVMEESGARTLVVNGAPEFVLGACAGDTAALHDKFAALSEEGFRVTAVATKPVGTKETYTWDEAAGLSFVGFLTFLDVPKLSAKEALADLARLNVAVKIVTGDNEIITKKVCREVGMEITGIMLGSEIAALSDEELQKRVLTANVFARTAPDEKVRVVSALKDAGHTVGYLGDGVNDIPSLRAADVGISVNSAVDVAKDAAQIVLLSKGLQVIADGIAEGRKTFANTIKYILMGTSSNFGNMFSAAAASFFLPFLPMTPVQILLTNGLYDVSQLSISTDNVDPESTLKPRHWDIKFIRNYMLFFGPISSLYDFLTFGVMLFVFHASGALFQTGWFIESMMTEILVVFVIRTSRLFFRSRPSAWLTGTCLALVGIALLLPFSPLAKDLGFVALPPLYFGVLILLVGSYLALVGVAKRFFLRRFVL